MCQNSVVALGKVQDMIAALEQQVNFWEQLPSGWDSEADPLDESPEDMSAHIAGLAIREAREAIDQAKAELERT